MEKLQSGGVKKLKMKQRKNDENLHQGAIVLDGAVEWQVQLPAVGADSSSAGDSCAEQQEDKVGSCDGSYQ